MNTSFNSLSKITNSSAPSAASTNSKSVESAQNSAPRAKNTDVSKIDLFIKDARIAAAGLLAVSVYAYTQINRIGIAYNAPLDCFYEFSSFGIEPCIYSPQEADAQKAYLPVLCFAAALLTARAYSVIGKSIKTTNIAAHTAILSTLSIFTNLAFYAHSNLTSSLNVYNGSEQLANNEKYYQNKALVVTTLSILGILAVNMKRAQQARERAQFELN